MRNVGGVKYKWLDEGTILYLKGSALRLLFSFLFYNYGAYYSTVAKVSQLYTRTQSAVSFTLSRSRNWPLLL